MSNPTSSHLELALALAEDDMHQRHERDGEEFVTFINNQKKRLNRMFGLGMTSLLVSLVFFFINLPVFGIIFLVLSVLYKVEIDRNKFEVPKLLPIPPFEVFLRKAKERIGETV